MLLARRRVLDCDVADRFLPAEEPAGTGVQGNRVEEIFVLEDVETPRLRGWGQAGFGGFVVFEDDAGVGDGVCFGG